jgi:ArsR family metal-binding transcriptional regulator
VKMSIKDCGSGSCLAFAFTAKLLTRR